VIIVVSTALLLSQGDVGPSNDKDPNAHVTNFCPSKRRAADVYLSELWDTTITWTKTGKRCSNTQRLYIMTTVRLLGAYGSRFLSDVVVVHHQRKLLKFIEPAPE
jgi:hypothetical protein